MTPTRIRIDGRHGKSWNDIERERGWAWRRAQREEAVRLELKERRENPSPSAIRWLDNLFCYFGRCRRCRQSEDDVAVWGQCLNCGKQHGYTTRAEIRRYLDKLYGDSP